MRRPSQGVMVVFGCSRASAGSTSAPAGSAVAPSAIAHKGWRRAAARRPGSEPPPTTLTAYQPSFLTLKQTNRSRTEGKPETPARAARTRFSSSSTPRPAASAPSRLRERIQALDPRGDRAAAHGRAGGRGGPRGAGGRAGFQDGGRGRRRRHDQRGGQRAGRFGRHPGPAAAGHDERVRRRTGHPRQPAAALLGDHPRGPLRAGWTSRTPTGTVSSNWRASGSTRRRSRGWTGRRRRISAR